MKRGLGTLWVFIAILFGYGSCAQAQYADIQQARINEIAAMIPAAPQALAQPCKDRAAWEPIAGTFTPEIGKAVALLRKPFPSWSDDDYMDYYKSGSRQRGEAMLHARDSWLQPLLLAECAEWKGRFLPALTMVLHELATQKSWSLPAHDVDQGYITGKRYFVELNSSQMGYMLATSLALLGDKLPAKTRAEVIDALETRMFRPMRASYTSGKGQTWLRVTSNWNAVCLAGVTGAALAVLQDRNDRAFFLAAAEYYQRFYKESFTADGFEVEGIGYWNYGFSNYAILREELWQPTKGQIDLFQDAQMQKVARFGRDIQMLPGVIAYFSDAHYGTQPDPELMKYIAHTFHDQVFQAQAVGMGSETLAFRLVRLFPSHSEIHEPSANSDDSRLRTFYPIAGVLVDRPRSEKGLAFTIKAAGDGPHNHNDIGSYAIGLGTVQPVGEPGGPSFYTSQTFSKDRFLSKLLNSYGHPVPVIGGHLQRDSLKVKAPVIATHFADSEDSLSIDMTDAYDAPVLKRLVRKITYSRLQKGSVDIADSYEVNGPTEIEEAITTHGQWKQVDGSTVDFTVDGKTVRATITAPAGMKITSEDLKEYGVSFTRIALHVSVHPGDTIRMDFAPLPQ